MALHVEGRRLGLLIGCNEFDHSSLDNLRFAVKDASELYSRLSDPEIGGFSEGDQIELLENPDFKSFATKLFDLLRQAQRNDSVLIYYSGHGMRDEGGRLFLAAKDTDRENPLEASAISADSLKNRLNNCLSKKVCLILDCCSSGAIGERGGEAEDKMEANLGGDGRVTITSAQASQAAKEDEQFSHGVFTHFALEGIDTGAADQNDDNLVTPQELYEYICKRMHDAGIQRQTPTMTGSFAGGTFALTRGKQQDESWRDHCRGIKEQYCGPGRREYLNAIDVISTFKKSALNKKDIAFIDDLLKSIEEEQNQQCEDLRKKILSAERENLINETVGYQIRQRLKQNKDFLFRAITDETHKCERLIRNYYLGKIEAEYLQEEWSQLNCSDNIDKSIKVEGFVEVKQKNVDATDVNNESNKITAADNEQPGKEQNFYQFLINKIKTNTAVQRLAIASIAIIFLAVIVSYWEVISPPTFNPKSLRVGVLLTSGTTKDANTIYTQLLKNVNNKIRKYTSDDAPFQFKDDSVETYNSREKIVNALKANKIDFAGVLPPRQVYLTMSERIAEPVVTPQYNGEVTYSAVFFSRKPRDSGINPVSSIGWSDLLKSLKGKEKVFLATMGKDSTSGYWYPRETVLKGINFKKSFDSVTAEMRKESEIFEAVCSKDRDVIAGVVAAYKFNSSDDHCKEYSDDEAHVLHVIKSVKGIPHGAFVATASVYQSMKDQSLEENIASAWGEGVVELYKDNKFKDMAKRFFPRGWSRAKPEQYTTEIFDPALDRVATKHSKDLRTNLMIAAIVLILGCLGYLVIRMRHSKTTQGQAQTSRTA